MTDLAVAFGLVLVLEGLLWALAPEQAKRMLFLASAMPEQSLRRLGAGAAIAGLLIVWLIRG